MEPRIVTLRPRPPWFGGTLQTARALRWPIPPRLPGGHRLWLPLPDGDALAATLHLPEARPPTRPLAALVHGIANSEDEPYLREAAAGLLRRGFPVLRINLRGNAKSQPRSTSHYHLGRSADLADALAALPEALTGQGVVLAGWSLGGALVLLLLAREVERPGMPPHPRRRRRVPTAPARTRARNDRREPGLRPRPARALPPRSAGRAGARPGREPPPSRDPRHLAPRIRGDRHHAALRLSLLRGVHGDGAARAPRCRSSACRPCC